MGLCVARDYGYQGNHVIANDEGLIVGEIPRYSIKIEKAWQLIEHHPHFVSLMRSVDVTRFGFADHMTWKCRFYAPQSLEVEAETAPLAICLAALKAVGVEL